MLLSIITVNLNNITGLQKTIDSVICQTFKDFEWIVIDGGSTDGSRELIEQYADHISYWVCEPDNGIYNAMNKGILASKGEYCFFLNSGDRLIDDDSLQRAFEFNFFEDVVWGNPAFDRVDSIEMGCSPNEISLNTFIGGTIHHSGNSFIKRHLFDNGEYGLYDETLKIVSDWKWFLKALGLGNATARHIDITLSVFDCTGISETQKTLRIEERDNVLKEVVPARILSDYIIFLSFDDILYAQELRIRESLAYKIGHLVLAPLRFVKYLITKYK